VRNLITDVPGLSVGNAHDARIASGATVILADAPTIAAATVIGGGPGTRERDAIGLEGTVGEADAIVLSGGSAYGLDAASGVQIWLRENGRGFQVGPVRVPIVPQAILFDLLNGGDKDWGRGAPYRELGFRAVEATTADFALGSAGAGYGGTVARGAGLAMRGGLGSASERVTFGGETVVIGALAAVNAAGAVTVADTRHFWAAPYERGAEFGGLGFPHPFPADAARPVLKYGAVAGANTTLCVVATDAPLTQAQAKRMATMATAGMARAIHPVFSPLDGDIVFALATGRAALADPAAALPFIGAAAANCLARAIARGVYEADASLPDGTQSYRNLFASP